MRLSSRSILSPAHHHNNHHHHTSSTSSATSAALTTSLSRRLRRNSSLRGGGPHSPALFSDHHNNHEPSSPKVTCIGQVRVKTKKQGKKIKLRACGSRRAGLRPPLPPPPPSDGGVCGGGGTQRWVHFPLSICETICCLFPCSKPSCFSSSNNNNNIDYNNGRNDEVEERESGGTMCGGLLRWLVEVEGGGGKRRDVELVVGGSDEVEEREREAVIERERGGVVVMERECSRRRSIFDDMEFDDLFNNGINNVGCGNGGGDGGGGGRVSVCVPPKNALLLMRCRSDPKRMASLSRKLLEGQIGDYDGGGGGGEGVVEVEVKEEDCVRVCEGLEVVKQKDEGLEVHSEELEQKIECVKLDEVEELERKMEDLEVGSEELEGKMGVVEDGVDELERIEVLEVDSELVGEIGAVEDEVDELERKIGDLEVDTEELGEIGEVEEGVDELERTIEDLEVDSEGLVGEIGAVEDEVDELERKKEDLEVDREELEGKSEEVVESVKLDEVDEEIGEVVNELERKWEDLEVDSVELERKMEENDGVQEETEEIDEGVENSEEAEVGQGIEVCEAKEIRDETVERQNTEVSEKDEQGLQHLKESCLMEGENVAVGCSVETFVDEQKVDEENVAVGCSIATFIAEEKMEEIENEDGFPELSEDQAVETERDESYELFTNSSSSSTSSEVSQELDLKQKETETESEAIEVEEATVAQRSLEMKKNNRPMLPDCLLLMMCEPKLSMEVSKETWISSTDFIRCLPERHRSKKSNKTDCSDDQSSVSNKKTKPAAVAAQPPQLPETRVVYPGIHPGRSSISFPTGGGPVTNLIEQKLAKVGVGYEPLVLPRCKSAPMRSNAKFLQPELACSMWGRENGRGLEPHRPATCGVGAAGIGF
ncbi:uncharacterized protein LOC141656369 [Silene latifolia]|uniref:uncharacterized protein LOC141656369 n=1 Tax=Silene latifolia TaxID=37657 RepID=UPI003D7779ED